MFRQGALRKQC